MTVNVSLTVAIGIVITTDVILLIATGTINMIRKAVLLLKYGFLAIIIVKHVLQSGIRIHANLVEIIQAHTLTFGSMMMALALPLVKPNVLMIIPEETLTHKLASITKVQGACFALSAIRYAVLAIMEEEVDNALYA